MKSLLLKIKAIEFEIEKNKDFISLHQALLHEELSKPKNLCTGLAASFIGGFLYPFIFKSSKKSLTRTLNPTDKIKHHINTAQRLYKKYQAIMPILTMLRLIP